MPSVVTICRNRHNHLARLMAGLSRSDERVDELIVVDMGSDCSPAENVAGHVAALKARRCVVRFVEVGGAGDRNDNGVLPLAAARNSGADAATGDRLIFLDVDCIPGRSLVDSYVTAPPLTLTCGPVRYLRQGWADPSFSSAGTPDDIDRVLCVASDDHPERVAPAVSHSDDRYEMFWSLSFSLQRSTWDRIGGFDERYVGYGAEDTDFAFEARRIGVPLWWLAKGTAFHQWHESPQPPSQHLGDIVHNAKVFRRKWDRWPMEGWLAEFERQGLILWERSSDSIELAR